ncbi:MAG: type II toxin-antitoxin system VapC family toxin [Rudaea sp.]
MIVVDTNILVPLFISGPRSADAARLLRQDRVWCTEPLALVELINIFATYQRSKLLTADAANRHLGEAEHLLTPYLHAVERRRALEFAARFKVSGYDAHFLATAHYCGKRLITEDSKLRVAAPALTQSIADALAYNRP